jgi:hypothetical protein
VSYLLVYGIEEGGFGEEWGQSPDLGPEWSEVHTFNPTCKYCTLYIIVQYHIHCFFLQVKNQHPEGVIKPAFNHGHACKQLTSDKEKKTLEKLFRNSGNI